MKGISLRQVPNAPVAGAVAEMSEGERALAAVHEDFALRRAEAQDFVGLVALQERRVAALEGFRAEAASRPEDGWVADWRGQDGVLRREMERAELSPAAREEARREHERFMAFSSVEIGREANRRWVERGRETMGASADRLFQAGEVEEGLATLHRGRAAGFFSEAEVEERTARAESDQRTRLADGFLAEDPFGMEAEMEEARGTGRSELFPWMGEVEIAQRAEQARTAVRERRRAVTGTIDAAIVSGQVRDEAGVRRMAAEGRLPEDEVASLARSLRPVSLDTPEARADNLRARSVLMTALAETSGPAASGSKWDRDSLRRYAREHLTYEQRGRFLGEIEKQENGMPGKQSELGDVYGRIDRLVDEGGVGAVRSADGTINATEALPVYRRAIFWKEAFQAFLARNPGASSGEQRQWLSDQVRPYLALRGSRILAAQEGLRHV